MKRVQYILTHLRTHVTVLCLLAVVGTAAAQAPESERYSDLIERTGNMHAYDAMYHMLAFQRFHPDHAAIYYRLGDMAYTLLPSKDGLHNYEERAELLYKARLFYGNCIHFMGGKLPRGESFPTVSPAGKKVEYEDVEAYLRARLDTLNRWRAETDTLHDRFYRMVDRYETCRQLFLQFMDRYPSEKLAHLCLTDEDRDQLLQLEQLTKQFENDRQLFGEALQASPVPYYAPEFRQVSISTYRLDGVTPSDFLANDIPLWDYAGWTNTFLQVQQNTYLALMRDLVQEFTMIDYGMERFRQGQPVQIEADPRLPYRLECYDYQSPVAMFLRLEQQVASTTLQAMDSLTTGEQITDAELSARITANIEAQQRVAETSTLLRTFKQRVNELTAQKYAFFLRETKMATVERLVETAEQTLAFQQMLTQQIDEQLHAYANAYPKQFEAVDISDDQAASEAEEAAAK